MINFKPGNLYKIKINNTYWFTETKVILVPTNTIITFIETIYIISIDKEFCYFLHDNKIINREIFHAHYWLEEIV